MHASLVHLAKLVVINVGVGKRSNNVQMSFQKYFEGVCVLNSALETQIPFSRSDVLSKLDDKFKLIRSRIIQINPDNYGKLTERYFQSDKDNLYVNASMYSTLCKRLCGAC